MELDPKMLIVLVALVGGICISCLSLVIYYRRLYCAVWPVGMYCLPVHPFTTLSSAKHIAPALVRIGVVSFILYGTYVGIAYRYHSISVLVYMSIMVTMLVYISLRDIDERIVPHSALAYMGVLILVCIIYQIGSGHITPGEALNSFLVNVAASLLFIIVVLLLERGCFQESFGGGDIKLICILMLAFGWMSALFMLCIGCMCCLAHYALKVALAALIGLRDRYLKKYRKVKEIQMHNQCVFPSIRTPVPFVPYITMGVYICVMVM